MKINSVLRVVILTGLFLTPLLSLVVVSSLYFPYITGKNFLFRTIIEIIFVCFVALTLRDPSYRPRWKSPITISLVIFIIIIFLADLFGENFHKSFWSNYERMEGFITFLHLFGLFFVFSCIFNEKLWRRWFHTAFFVSLILGFNALIQHFHSGVERPAASLGNSTYLGALMLFNIFLLLFYLLRTIRQRQQNSMPKALNWTAILYAVVILFDAYILYITGTRGAFLGCLGGFIFIAVVLAIFEREQKTIRRAGIILSILIVLALGFMAVFRNSDFVKNNALLSRFSAPVNAVLTLNIKKFAETEGQGRLLIWQAALKGVKERPVLGWGQDNFNYVFNKYYDPQMYTQEQWFDRSHNVFLDWLSQAGILGLLSYLSLFGLLIYSIWRRGNNFSLEDRAVLTGLLIAYFIHNIFVFDNVTSYIFFFATLAYVNQNRPAPVKNNYLNINSDIATYAITPVVAIIIIFFFYLGVWKPYLAGAEVIKALTNQNSAGSGDAEAVPEAAANFQSALSRKTFGSPEIREQFLNFLPQVVSSNLDDRAKAGILMAAQTEMNTQLKETPNDARYFLFYGFTLDRLGDYKEAETNLARARELSPKKQAILFEQGLNLISQDRHDEALVILKQAYDEAPAYQEAKVYYAIGLIYAGKQKEADELIASIDPSIIVGDSRLLKAFFDTKQFQKIISIYHQRMADTPSDIQSYLGAAAFELALNNRAAAEADITKAIDFFSQLTDANSFNVTNTLKDYLAQIKRGENPLPLAK